MANEKIPTTQLSKDEQAQAAELLRKANERKARLAARSAEVKARKEAEARVREARKAANQPVKSDEEKSADFKRLAEHRLNLALDRIAQMRPLSGPQYLYDEKQVQTIINSLRAATDGLEAALMTSGKGERARVTL